MPLPQGRGILTLVFLAGLLLTAAGLRASAGGGANVTALPEPDFTLAVDVTQDGRTFTYTIHFENVGSGAAKTATLRDTLPEGSTFLGDPKPVIDGVWTQGYVDLAPGSYVETVSVIVADEVADGDRVVNAVELEYVGYTGPKIVRTHVEDVAFALPALPPAPLPLWVAAAPLAAIGSVTGGVAVARSRRGPKLEQVFLMHSSGMLIHHWAAERSPSRDIDILSGMFVILKEFVRDSFREGSGGLSELQFGDSRMFLAEGEHAILAAVARGKHVNGLPAQIATAVRDFEERHPGVLAHWTGQLDLVPEAKAVVEGLVRGEYGHRRFAA